MSSIEFADNTPLTDEEIRQAAAEGLRANYFYQDDELRGNWELSYGYYKGERPRATTAAKSTAVSTDVSDVVEWVLPQVLKSLESPDVVRFDPTSPEDQDQADIESDFVHHTFMKKCNGFVKTYVHVKDALLLKNAIFMTYWDEEVTSQVEEYKDLNQVELADLLSPDDGSEIVILEQETRQVGVTIPEWQQYPGAQQQALEVPIQTEDRFDVKVRRYRQNGRAIVENCEPEQFRVLMSHNSIDLKDARCCSYTLLKSRAEIYAIGYDKDVVDELGSDSHRYYDNEVRYAREDVERSENSFDRNRNETGDPSQDMIDLHRVYLQLDVNGDGYEEKILAILGGTHGDVLLDWYEVAENPFSASTPFIAGHKFYGYSIYDKIKRLADHKTKVLRLLEDNLELANNPRKKVLRGQAGLDGLLAMEPGGLWIEDQPGAVNEVPAPQIQREAYALLEYYDKQRAERSGVDPNAQSISNLPEESMNHAVERLFSAKEELVGLITRVFAETGIKDMFCKLRGVLMRNKNSEELAKLRNKWVNVNPANWTERTDTTIVIGGTGEQMRKSQALVQTYRMQLEALERNLSGYVVSPSRLRYTMQEFIRTQGLGDPDDFWLDPSMLSDPRNLQSLRGKETVQALAFQKQQSEARQKAAQAQQQAQIEGQRTIIGLQAEIEQMRQTTKLMEARMKEQQATQDRTAELLKFHEEMRHKWAELAAETTTERTKAAAQIGTKLVDTGLAAEEMANKGNGGEQA